MGTRTVRLDDAAERTLARLRRLTGMSISEVLKQGLLALEVAALEAKRKPYDVFRRLDLGEGGWAAAPAKRAKSAVRDTLRKKHGR